MAQDRDEKLQSIVGEVDGLLTHLKETVDRMSAVLKQDLNDGKRNDRTN